jgi:putative NIF3 family GTP cyclohydrolase 1 type 2
MNVRFVSGGEHPVKKVGLCSGSGAEFIERAAFMGCDAFVTGDVRYHDAQRAAALGIHVIDAGHFATEQPVIEILAAKLAEELDGKVEVVADDNARDFFETV